VEHLEATDQDMPFNNPQRPASYLKNKSILSLAMLDDQKLLEALEAIAKPTYDLIQFLKAEFSKRPKIYTELAYIAARLERDV